MASQAAAVASTVQLSSTVHSRKIDIQSPTDLLYLRSHLSRAALQKLDLHFPPTAAPDGEDVLRGRVGELVEEFIQKTFTLSTASVSVNGLAFPSSSLRALRNPNAGVDDNEDNEDNYEPHSTALAQKCQALSSTLEQETLELCMLRREAPEKAAREWKAAYEEALLGEEKSLEDGRAKLPHVVEGEMKGVKAVAVKRQGDVEESWKAASSGLEGLRGGLTGTRARLERAGDAVQVLEERR